MPSFWLQADADLGQEMKRSDRNEATGIEGDAAEDAIVKTQAGERVAEKIRFSAQHLRLTQVILSDVTDRHNELVQEREWLLHPSQREVSLSGNLFVIEDLSARRGKVLVKQEPLPHARPTPTVNDLRVTPTKGGGFEIHLLEPDGANQNSWTVLDYEGGILERTRALHRWQSSHRPDSRCHRLPRFISNTWGDRSRDSRIQQTFLESEIDAASQLGVDVVQIDDGWERGVTANSSVAQEKGGVWEGFYNSDPRFWETHPDRLPNGLEPIVERASSQGLGLGLWFAPDSWNDFENWQKDVDTIVGFHRRYGIEHIKIDGVKARTEASLLNLRRFFQGVLDQTEGNVIFDLDVTAEVRPGYFGAMNVGPLFVENRYTDFHNYWPHQTLRNLWQLSRWIDPRRLRMEFLNNARNQDLYADDPLGPERYDADTLFATVMFANPLGWFEVSNLPESYLSTATRLVNVWREHRADLFDGTILPIGKPPDGISYTGFISLSDELDAAYVLVFRENSDLVTTTMDLPEVSLPGGRWEVLAGSDGGIVESGESGFRITLPQRLGYVFARSTR